MTDRELMQMALDALELITSKPEKMSYYCSFAVEIEALRDRLAQPEQEPVAWWDGAGRFATAKEKDWDRRTGGILSFGRDIPLYTAPPQRVWQGLTDEEMSDAYNVNYNRYGQHVEYADFILVYRAIEAKLKEKNNG